MEFPSFACRLKGNVRTAIVAAISYAGASACLSVERVAPPTTLADSIALFAASHNATIAGFVLDSSDNCIVGARVELMNGSTASATFTQTVCGFWDYGDDLGFSFHNLAAGVPMTVRASAPGYKTGQIIATPSNPYQYTNYIYLAKDRDDATRRVREIRVKPVVDRR